MKYVKMLGLLAVAAAALMALAGTASATTITSPTNTKFTGEIHAVSEAHTTLVAANGIVVECNSTLTGHIEKHGAGITASGPITTLIFGTAATEGCTNGDVVHVAKPGTLEVHWIASGEGTVTSKGAEVTVTDNTGVTCVFTTESTGTHVGTLTDSHKTGKTPTIHVKSAKIPRTGGSILCGASGTWNGNYEITTPMELFIDKE